MFTFKVIAYGLHNMHSNITVMPGDTARYFSNATSILSLYYSEWFLVTQNEIVSSVFLV